MWVEGIAGWSALGAGVMGLALRAEFRMRRQRMADRAGIFTRCQSLLEAPELAVTRGAYPMLEGTAAGRRVRVEAVLDSLAVRKLPVLWLKTTVLAPLPGRAMLDYLRRPQNTEFWSPGASLPWVLPVPEHWPQHASLRASAPDAAQLMARLDPFREEFAAEDFKELVVSPLGLRVVTLAAQGSRLHYGVFRRAEFAAGPLPPERLTGPLRLAQRLHDALADPA